MRALDHIRFPVSWPQCCATCRDDGRGSTCMLVVLCSVDSASMYFRDGTSNMWSLGRVSCIEMAGTGARGHWLGRHVGSSSWAAVRRPGSGVPPSGVGAEPSPACRARGGGVVRGTASRAPVVSRVWRRRFEPQLKIRSCDPSHHRIQPSRGRHDPRPQPPRARVCPVSRKTINVRRAHDTSPSAPTRTHSELMTHCDHILMGSIEGPLVLRIRTSLCARDLRAATRASPRRGRLLTTEFTPSPHPRSTLE